MGKRIIVRRRGKGGIYSSPGHQHAGDIRHIPSLDCTGTVEEIFHARGPWPASPTRTGAGSGRPWSLQPTPSRWASR